MVLGGSTSAWIKPVLGYDLFRRCWRPCILALGEKWWAFEWLYGSAVSSRLICLGCAFFVINPQGIHAAERTLYLFE
jgi:hypothetical protein